MLGRMTSPPVEAPRLISIAATCARLQVSRRTLYRWVDRGILTVHRDPYSGRVGVEAATVEAAVARRVIVP